MKIWFIRHGESVANLQKVFSNQQVDHPLTPKGVEQVEHLAHSLKGVKFEKIYSSPVPRAVETAGILSNVLDSPVEITENLREFSVGILEGRSDAEAWQIFTNLWNDWIELGKDDQKIEGGENLIEIRARFSSFIRQLIREFGSEDKNILCVSHGGLYHAALPSMAENLNIQFCLNHPVGSAGTVIFEWTGEKWYCLEWVGTIPPRE